MIDNTYYEMENSVKVTVVHRGHNLTVGPRLKDYKNKVGLVGAWGGAWST